MVLIGFLLLAAAAVVGVDVAVQNDAGMDVQAFGQVLSTTPGGLFVAGIVTGIVAAVAIMVIRDGAIRRHERHLEARRDVEERDRLAAAYRAEHGDAVPAPNVDLREPARDSAPADVRARRDWRDNVGSRQEQGVTTF